MDELKGFLEIVLNFPFLLLVAAVFTLVYTTRRVLRVWLPLFESNRWFKTFLPIGTLLVAVGLAFIPLPGESPKEWGYNLLEGIFAGGIELIGYVFIRNVVREKMKALAAKTATGAKNGDTDRPTSEPE